MTFNFPRLTPGEIEAASAKPMDPLLAARAREIVERVRSGGQAELLSIAAQMGDLDDAPWIQNRAQLEDALATLPGATRRLLERRAASIEDFARRQRECLRSLDCAVPGGRAGHQLAPIERVGAYAPGGRYPLYSSVLMTVIPARVAGVPEIYLASPRADPVMCAVAAIAGVQGLLRVGGAQAIAALAFGVGSIPACRMIVGPGNSWVTAAKAHLMGQLAIDQLAGPSELVVLASRDADAVLIASDLIAQAEHDPEARSLLVTDSRTLREAVEVELAAQLEGLHTQVVARRSLTERGGSVLVRDLAEGSRLCDRLAPEHLALQGQAAEERASTLKNYGALFLGTSTPEAAGDYGAGPNHVLPTAGGAHGAGGLSVLSFLRVRTWLKLEAGAGSEQCLRDSADFARLEGLEAHARSAELRLAR